MITTRARPTLMGWLLCVGMVAVAYRPPQSGAAILPPLEDNMDQVIESSDLEQELPVAIGSTPAPSPPRASMPERPNGAQLLHVRKLLRDIRAGPPIGSFPARRIESLASIATAPISIRTSSPLFTSLTKQLTNRATGRFDWEGTILIERRHIGELGQRPGCRGRPRALSSSGRRHSFERGLYVSNGGAGPRSTGLTGTKGDRG